MCISTREADSSDIFWRETFEKYILKKSSLSRKYRELPKWLLSLEEKSAAIIQKLSVSEKLSCVGYDRESQEKRNSWEKPSLNLSEEGGLPQKLFSHYIPKKWLKAPAWSQ